jgi:peptidoglycan/LPS O-acetylase OafA/YrhL
MINNKKYYENLDGWRFLCFLSVFFFHNFHTTFNNIKTNSTYIFVKKDIFGNGNIGVNFFFVLSGFLITTLIIQEIKTTSKLDIIAFWKRRILRIWPLFYFCVIFGFILFPLIKQAFGQVSNETASWPMYLSFLNNFDLIKNGLPDSSILGVLWSVAVEEQFYFIWPILLAITPIRFYWIIFLVIVSLSISFRFLNNEEILLEHHTLSCIGDMAIGGFGGWIIMFSKRFLLKIENLNRYIIYFIYLSFIFIFFFRYDFFMINITFRPFERIIVALIILFIILEQNYSRNSFFKMSQFKMISSLGKMTYGMYCLHFVGILISLKITEKLGLNKNLWQVLILETSVALLFTIIIAKFSYTYFEQPFLKFKNRYNKI